MTAPLRIGPLQRDAFSIFVEEADDCALPGDATFPGHREDLLVHIDAGRHLDAWRRLIDAVNELDSMGWTEHRDALQALATRVLRARGASHGRTTRGNPYVSRVVRPSQRVTKKSF